MMRLAFTFFFLLCNLNLAAQVVNDHLEFNLQDAKKGVINDPDGYTNIRSGQGTEFEVIGKLFEDEIFLYSPVDSSNWWVVYKYWNLYGFVHKSRIKDISTFTAQELKPKLSAIFRQELKLFREESSEWMDFHEKTFNHSLGMFESYVCRTKDEEMFKLFISILQAEDGSADESPAFALGKVFLCQPDWVLSRIQGRTGLLLLLEHGAVQHFSGKRDAVSLSLRKKLTDFRRSHKLKQVDYDNYY